MMSTILGKNQTQTQPRKPVKLIAEQESILLTFDHLILDVGTTKNKWQGKRRGVVPKIKQTTRKTSWKSKQRRAGRVGSPLHGPDPGEGRLRGIPAWKSNGISGDTGGRETVDDGA